jgi:hypothetical protein
VPDQEIHAKVGNAPDRRFWLLWKTEGIARDLTQNIHSAYAKRKEFRYRA